jgi:predicted bacteriocin transport accessory protein
MGKVTGVIALCISVICLLACTINVFISIDTYGKNKTRIIELEDRVLTLESELSNALGYDITDEEAGETSGVYDTTVYKTIKGSELAELSKGKKIVVWIGRQGCSYCSLYAPTIKSVGKDLGITIHYIDLAAMYDTTQYQWVLTDQASYDAITGMETTNDEAASVMEDFGSTPMTIIVEDGKVIGGVVGAVDKTTVKETLTNAGIKK